jgi:hypothetical protein
MLRIQGRHVDWERHQIAIRGRHAKDAENRRIPFDRQGRLAPVLKRRASLGANAYVFGSPAGNFVADFKTAWESLLLIANGHETKRTKPGARVDRAKLRQIDLHWHDPASRRRVSPPGGARVHPHDPTDARPRRHQADAAISEHHGRRAAKSMTGVWERRRRLKAVGESN